MKLNLKQSRQVRGLTIEEMAEKLDIHAHTYRAWEKNPQKVSVGNAKRIAFILEFPVDHIFFAE